MKRILLFLCFVFTLSSFSQSWFSEGTTFTNGIGINTEQYQIDIDSEDNTYILLKTSNTGTGRNLVRKYDGSNWSTLGQQYISDGVIPSASGVTGEIYQSLTIDDQDNIYVAYVDPTILNKVAVKRWDGDSWSYVGSADGIATNTQNIKDVVLKTYNDDLYISYFLPGVGIVVGQYSSISNTWNLVGNLNISSTANYVDLALNSSGTPYLVYQDTSNNMTTIKMFDGNDWILVGQPISGNNIYHKIRFKNNDTPLICYITDSSVEFMNIKEYDGTSWVNYGNITNPFFPNGFGGLSFAIDSNNKPYIAFLRSGRGSVITLNDATNNWEFVPSGQVNVTSSSTGFNALALDTQDVIHYAYRVTGNGYCLYYEDTLSDSSSELEKDTFLFPNPTSTSFTIKTNDNITSLKIFNLQGQLVKSFTGQLNEYNIQDLNSGSYLIRIKSSRAKVNKILIIQ